MVFLVYPSLNLKYHVVHQKSVVAVLKSISKQFKNLGHIADQIILKKNRDISMVFIIGFYILNILDANIDAHLKQYNVNENLTIRPYFDNGLHIDTESIGLTLNLNF